MEFKIKRDFLPIFIINLVLAFILVVPTIAFGNWVGYLIAFDVVILTIIVLYNTSVIFSSCKLENNTLYYRAGIFKYEIDLNTIKNVSLSRNIHFSLANSLDRIRISTLENGKQKVYYVSVCDNENLLSLLKPKKEEKVVETKIEEKPAEEKKTEEKTTKTVKTTTKKPATTKKAPAKTTVKKPATKKTTTAKKTTTSKKVAK